MKTLALSALVVLGTMGNALAAEAEAEPTAAQPQDLAAVCAGCHGADGNSFVPNFPKLAGQHASYLEKQLNDLKEGTKRTDPIMAGQVAALTAEDMAALAEFFASQTASPGSSAADAEVLERGKAIYHGGDKAAGIAACMSCHGPTGEGVASAKFPALKGQHAVYISKAVTDFRSKARTNDYGEMMQNIAAKMSDEDIAAVAEYIASMQ